MSISEFKAVMDDLIARRNKALLDFDLVALADLMREQGDRVPPPDVMELVAHKLRYECAALPREARLKSATYLRKNNYTRWNGTPLLAHGELPQ